MAEERERERERDFGIPEERDGVSRYRAYSVVAVSATIVTERERKRVYSDAKTEKSEEESEGASTLVAEKLKRGADSRERSSAVRSAGR